MKLTKEQLQKIIQEEITTAIKEGELDEGFLDRLFGRDSEFSDILSSEKDLKNKILKVQNSLKDIARTARSQNNRELENMASDLSSKVANMSAITVPSGTGAVSQSKSGLEPEVKRIDMSDKAQSQTFINFRDDLRNKITSKTPRQLALMHNKLVPKSQEIDPQLQVDREEMEMKKYKGALGRTGKDKITPEYNTRKALANRVLDLLDQALIDSSKFGGETRRQSALDRTGRQTRQRKLGESPEE